MGQRGLCCFCALLGLRKGLGTSSSWVAPPAAPAAAVFVVGQREGRDRGVRGSNLEVAQALSIPDPVVVLLLCRLTVCTASQGVQLTLREQVTTISMFLKVFLQVAEIAGTGNPN